MQLKFSKIENTILMTSNIVDPYLHVSHIYHQLMNFVDYKWWAGYIYLITSKNLKKDAFVLELAAGNCLLSAHLSKQYKNYYSTDLSFSMLSTSSYKKNKTCCSMTSIPFKKKFDLIVSSFDSVNYLLSKAKLKKLFVEVCNSLSDEGVFTFDAVLESNSYKHQKNTPLKGTAKRILYRQKSIYMPKSKIHKNIFSITYPDGKSYTETHRQKVFDFETYFELAEKSGLYVVNCYKAFSLTKGKATSDRLQFIMKRI
jgi:ubiquinone/menaquinone biosynthesis C-methylase UbiE